MRKLMLARKVWKFFTNTLQSKLHKLNKSKAIKKSPKRRLNQKNQKKLACWPSFSIQSPRKNQKYRFKHTQKLRIHKHHHIITRKPSPVYIDQLFLETASTTLLEVGPVQSASAALTQVRPSKKKEIEEKVRPSVQPVSAALVRVRPMQTASATLLTKEIEEEDYENEGPTCNETMRSPEVADDMWESLGLESPLTHRINERADEFIARFRAEMQNEETFYSL